METGNRCSDKFSVRMKVMFVFAFDILMKFLKKICTIIKRDRFDINLNNRLK